jgi:hypothetical protein
MATVSELVSKRIGSTITDSQTWNIMYNSKQYSSEGNGTTNDSSALSTLINTTINGAQATIIFPRGTYRIGTALTVPSNVTLYLPQGANFTIDAGITLTINGPIDAGLYQIFSGSGTISGSPKIEHFYPQWWGVKGDGTTNDATTLNTAINALPNNYTLMVPDGTYVINGGSTTAINRNGFTNIKIRGTGNSIIQIPDVATETIPVIFRNGSGLEVSGIKFVCLESSTKAVEGLTIMNSSDVHIHHCEFHDFTFYGLAVYEDTIGGTSAACNNLLIEDNYFEGCRTIALEIFPKTLSDLQIIRNNTFSSCGKSPISGEGAAYKAGQAYNISKIYGNTAIDCGEGASTYAAGLTMFGVCDFHDNDFINCKRAAITIGVQTHVSYSSPKNYELLIHNNTVSREPGFTIGTDEAITLTVTDVTNYNTNKGMIKIFENKINNYYRVLFSRPTVDLERLSILNNEFSGITNFYMYTDNANGGVLVKPIIAGNKFLNYDLTRATLDLNLNNIDSAILVDNTFLNSGEYAISLASCTNSTIVTDNKFINGNVTSIAGRGPILISDSSANSYYLVDNRMIGGNWDALFVGTSGTPTVYVEGNTLPNVHKLATNSTPTINITEILGKHTATVDTAVSGYIEVKDNNDVTRKVAVIT